MNSLFKNDWYKSGIKLTILIAAIFGLIVLSYISAGAWGLTTTVYYAPTDTYVINPDSIYTMNRIYTFQKFYCDHNIAIWLLPIITTVITGKMFSDDTVSGWRKSAAAMPFTNKQIVLEKYLFGLLFMGASIVFVTICQIVFAAVLGVFDFYFMILFFLRYCMVFFFISAIFTPIAMKKSFSSAVLTEVLIVVILPVFISFITMLFHLRSAAYAMFFIGETIHWLYDEPLGIIIGSIASIILYAASFFVCLQLAKKKNY